MPQLIANMVQVHPYRLRDGLVEHLLLRRSETEQYGPGIWQVITGGIETGERSSDAAVRELREETGLDAGLWFALPGIAAFYFAPADQMILSPMFACLLAPEAIPVLSSEHSEYCWLDTEDACRRLVYPTHVQGVRELAAEIGDRK